MMEEVDEHHDTTNTAGPSCEEMLLYPPVKRRTSAVWNYFGYAKIRGEIKEDGFPICRACAKKISAKGGNTSNMFTHLREHHPALFLETQPSIKRKRLAHPATFTTTADSTEASSSTKWCRQSPENLTQYTMEKMFEKQKKYDRTSKSAQQMNAAVAFFIAKDMVPYYIVERPGFKHLVNQLNPKYELPSRTFFSGKEIPKLYSALRNEVQEAVGRARWFAATTDLWTSNGGKGEPYISLTLHHISSEWVMQSHCLETLYVPEDHTAEHIAEIFEGMLQQWQVDINRLTCIGTDNASNMKKAFQQVLKVPHLSCFGHNLNLGIQKCLKIQRVDTAVKSCRRLVESFSRSWKKRRELTLKQTDLNVPKHSLIHDVVTRWGSTYDMIERFTEQQQAVCAVLAADRNLWHLMPKQNDMTNLEDISLVLGSVHMFTDSLASGTRVTASAIRPILNHLLNNVLVCAPTDRPLAREMKETIAADLSSRYEAPQTRLLLDICSFLDPRFKEHFLSNVSDTTEAIKENALQEKHSLEEGEDQESDFTTATMTRNGTPQGSEEQRSEQQLQSLGVPSPTPVVASKKTVDVNPRKGLHDLLWEITESVKQSTSIAADSEPEAAIIAQVEHYKALPILPGNEDPLIWWKQHQKELPILSHLAQKYLCIPATSVPSERVFSSSGYILSPFRSRLSTEHVNMLVFLHHNL
ncbi:E3 SUMO-protein ligase ZBED1-like [Ambystoma mexicanum]|uniref:E3 SUMO-protein ligase ZBED1-like n=1 Tax=Ambystoma mexicanum TaxID=8296 RepID=UPI0037E89E0D